MSSDPVITTKSIRYNEGVYEGVFLWEGNEFYAKWDSTKGKMLYVAEFIYPPNLTQPPLHKVHSYLYVYVKNVFQSLDVDPVPHFSRRKFYKNGPFLTVRVVDEEESKEELHDILI